MDFRRIKQVCKYGWKDALSLSQEEGVYKGRIAIFLDILYCFFKYNVWSNQYNKEKLHLVNREQKKMICLNYQEKNTKRDLWVKSYFDNYKFLNKWSDFKYEQSAALQAKRKAAYKKQYGLGENCFVGFGVLISKHHYAEAPLIIGNDCHLAEECVIDYTGGLILEPHVGISEGVKILTHNHTILGDTTGTEKKKMVPTPLVIEDNAWIGTRVVILPGVERIGRRATIAAGTIVRHKVPPYSIVMGNPSKIVGFSLTPDQVAEFEQTIYPIEKRTDIIKYTKEYNKFFLEKTDDINKFLKKTC